jgi:hypothetical protein
MTQALRFGGTCTLNRNTGTFGSPVWSPINVVVDNNLNEEYDKADASTRFGYPIKCSEPTLLGITIEFTMLEDIADTNYLALRAAFLAKTPVEFMASTGVATTTSEPSTRVTCKIIKFSKGEPLNGIDTYNVSAEPCYSPNPAIFV